MQCKIKLTFIIIQHLYKNSPWIYSGRCPPLNNLVYGKISPARCFQPQQSAGSICRVTCEGTYVLAGSENKYVCQTTGHWHPQINSIYCEGRFYTNIHYNYINTTAYIHILGI